MKFNICNIIKKGIISFLIGSCILLAGCGDNANIGQEQSYNEPVGSSYESITNPKAYYDSSNILDTIPPYNGNPYIVLNGNIPNFDIGNISINEPLQFYSNLDVLRRCGYAMAIVSKDTLTTEKRGSIESVHPTGWNMTKFQGEYLYNRCHLIGYQLTGQNANPKNLITGTRYLNVIGMLPFENRIHAYVSKQNGHVLYRVTPLFYQDELVARGVQMEGYSIDDNGKTIRFNVFCYNVQPNVIINYKTGKAYIG